MRKVKALSVSVFKNPMGDCTNNGISSKYNTLLLVGKDVEGYIDVDLDNPPENLVVLVKRNTWGNHEHIHVEPLDGCHAEGEKQYMAGGNFCYTSESRFPNSYTLAIHDRRE